MARQLTDEEILAYKDKEATAVQERYADWLIEKLQLEFPNTKAEGAFREAVRIATALRMIFQASPENQGARSETKVAKAAPPAEAAAVADETAPDEAPKKGKGGRKAKPAPAPVAPDESDGDKAVAPAARPSAPKKAQPRTGTKAPF